MLAVVVVVKYLKLRTIDRLVILNRKHEWTRVISDLTTDIVMLRGSDVLDLLCWTERGNSKYITTGVEHKSAHCKVCKKTLFWSPRGWRPLVTLPQFFSAVLFICLFLLISMQWQTAVTKYLIQIWKAINQFAPRISLQCTSVFGSTRSICCLVNPAVLRPMESHQYSTVFLPRRCAFLM